MMQQGAQHPVAGMNPGAPDLVLRPNCAQCGAAGDLFATQCRHLTLCYGCAKSLVMAGATCSECRAPLRHLIKEYKVKKAPDSGKQHFLGRFPQGLPPFSTKSDVNWSMRKDIPRPADPVKQEKFKLTAEKLKSKPWILEDDTGAHQYQGQLEGGQRAAYYTLMKQGKDFNAIPAGPWFNFHKLVQYKQLTLEEAEEQMKNRRKTADGYQRWMMRAANGAAAFGEVERPGPAGNKRKGEGDEENDKKKGGKPAEDDDFAKPEDFDPEDEVDRGDDWEHEETFTDDDEAVGNDPEEREELGPDVPAPPEIKQEEEDELETEGGQPQEGGGLSQSGRDMKKLLGKSTGIEEEEEEDDEEDEDDDPDNEDYSSPVLAPTRKDGESSEPAPAKPANAAASKGKRKAEEAKAPAPKKAKPSKTEAKKDAPKKETAKKDSSKSTGPVTEEEVKAALRKLGPLKSQDLVGQFKSRLSNKEEKDVFAGILRRISKIQKRDGVSYIVMKES